MALKITDNIRSALNVLADHVWSVSKSKGFKDEPVPVSTSCANLHGEVSELWEAFRAGKLNEPCDKAEGMRKLGLEPLTCAEEEIADVIIRALDTAKDLGIDAGRAVAVKDFYNQHRPHRNGGKLA